MSARDPSPWDVPTGAVAPPPWQGPAHVHLLMSDGDAQPDEETPPPPPPETERVCTQCEQEFPLTTEFFHAHKRKRGGFRTVCKGCVNGERPSRAKPAPVWWTDANEQPKDPQ